MSDSEELGNDALADLESQIEIEGDDDEDYSYIENPVDDSDRTVVDDEICVAENVEDVDA